MKICNCCDQVVPTTDEGKSVAAEKTAAARAQIQAANDVWEVFSKEHPVRGFWQNNTGIGFVTSVCLGVVAFFLVLTRYPLNSGFQSLLYSFLAYLIVAGSFAYVFSERPSKRGYRFMMAVRNAFILRHKVQAEILGFEMYRE